MTSRHQVAAPRCGTIAEPTKQHVNTHTDGPIFPPGWRNVSAARMRSGNQMGPKRECRFLGFGQNKPGYGQGFASISTINRYVPHSTKHRTCKTSGRSQVRLVRLCLIVVHGRRGRKYWGGRPGKKVRTMRQPQPIPRVNRYSNFSSLFWKNCHWPVKTANEQKLWSTP